jgi:hypothetical protein
MDAIADNRTLRQKAEQLEANNAQHKLETAVALEVLTRIGTADQIHEATSAIIAARKQDGVTV